MEGGGKKRGAKTGKIGTRRAEQTCPGHAHTKWESSKLKILYGNVQSVIGKLDELRTLVWDLKPDIVCINETWTNNSHNKALLNLKGYAITCRCDRQDTSEGRGGGLLVYVREDIPASEVDNSIYNKFNQCCSIKLQLPNNNNVEILLVYRPHKIYASTTDLSTNNELLCKVIDSVSKPCIVMGDFNCSDIDWDLGFCGASSKDILESIQDKFLTQHVTFPTHRSGTMPDIVLSSNANMIYGIENVEKLGKSDHTMLLVDASFEIQRTSSIEQVPDWKKADVHGLVEAFSHINWTNELNDLCYEESLLKFTTVLDELQTKFVPLKQRRSSNKPLWMNRNLIRIIRKKRRLWKVYSSSKDYQNYLAYKSVEKSMQRKVRAAKRKFERKLAKSVKKNPKSFYAYLKSKTSTKESVGPLKVNGITISDNKEMVELLNSFFSSVFTHENLSDTPEPNVFFTGDSPLSYVSFSAENVHQKISKLRIGSAPGPDKITARILHEVSDYVSQPLALIYDKSLHERTVSSSWKSAHVCPVFKKGSKGDVGNYRPISLTSIICKLMESILKDAILQHLLENNLLCSSQHGFLPGRSCLTNLLEYLELLTKLVDKGLPVDVIYLDFAKAFDKVPHQRLLAKLRAVGISGNILDWICDWLSGRRQRVVLNGEVSDWKDVLSGVPQGSVLGPILFLIFINDIDGAVDTVGTVLFKFADDTKLLQVVRNDADHYQLQSAINNLASWSQDWQMLFNNSKCHVMHFGARNLYYSYVIGGYAPAGSVIESVSTEKDLGVFIDHTLKPSVMCAKSAVKANQVLGQMAKVFTYRDKHNWVKLYKTYVRPHLEYAIQAWSPSSVADIDILENVQKRAIRMVSGLSSKDYEERLAEVGLLSLKSRRTRGDMIQVWKMMNGFQSVDAGKWFATVPSVSTQFTRLADDPLCLRRPTFSSDIRKNFFSVRVIDLWNSLPAPMKISKDMDMFKDAYDKFGIT